MKTKQMRTALRTWPLAGEKRVAVTRPSRARRPCTRVPEAGFSAADSVLVRGGLGPDDKEWTAAELLLRTRHHLGFPSSHSMPIRSSSLSLDTEGCQAERGYIHFAPTSSRQYKDWNRRLILVSKVCTPTWLGPLRLFQEYVLFSRCVGPLEILIGQTYNS